MAVPAEFAQRGVVGAGIVREEVGVGDKGPRFGEGHAGGDAGLSCLVAARGDSQTLGPGIGEQCERRLVSTSG